MKKKPLKEGLDFVRDRNWRPKVVTRKGAERLGWRLMDAALKRCGFVPVVCDCGDYFRVSFSKPEPRRW